MLHPDQPASRPPAYARRLKAGVLAANLLLVAVVVLVMRQAQETHRAAARANAENLARFLRASLGATFGNIDLTLRTVADEHRRLSEAGPIDGAALEAFIARHKERTPDTLSLRIFDAEGRSRHGVPPTSARVTVADRDYFVAQRDATGDAVVLSRPMVGRIVQGPVIVAARRLSTPAGAFAGVVTSSIALERLGALFTAVEVGRRGLVEIRWRDGTLVAGKGPPGPAQAFGDPRVPDALRRVIADGDAAATFDDRSPIDGVARTYAARAVPDVPLLVVVGLAPDDFLAGWRRAAVALSVLVVGFLLLTVAVAWFATPAWHRAEVERLLAERTEHLRESEERFRIAFQTSPDSINLTRVTDGAYVAVNEGFLRLTGFTEAEVLGRSSVDLGIWGDPADRERLVEAVRRDGYLENLETRFRGKDGRIIHGLMSARRIVLRGEPLLLTITRDVGAWKAAEAERDRLQVQVQQAQRLEGIGRLAGGVAHDFNNLLTVILSAVESLRDRVGAAAEPREDVEQIAAAAGRARDLTRQLLAFARKQVIAPVTLDLRAVLRDGERLLRRLLGEDVEFTVVAEDGLWPVVCDPSQLEQVILNLAVNARDAMPSGGTLSITASNADRGPVDPQTGARRPGAWVRLSVRDSGIGMTPEVQAHLFEPFFTTKGAAAGTGLGLATVHGIVAQNGGHVEVETAPGQGARFDVYLPRAQPGAVPLPPRDAAAPPAPAAAGGGETILVVEDDPLVRGVTVRALQGAGYRVCVASAGAEALGVVAEHDGPVDLVVTDVVMPGLSGPEVVAALRAVRPGLRALYVSGYPRDAIAQRGVLESGVELLPKPFTSAALLERVRAVLDGRGAADGEPRAPDLRRAR